MSAVVGLPIINTFQTALYMQQHIEMLHLKMKQIAQDNNYCFFMLQVVIIIVRRWDV